MKGSACARSNRICGSLVLLIALIVSPALAVQAPVTDDLHIGMQGRGTAAGAPDLKLDGDSAVFMRFDLATLPTGISGQDVASATLNLWIERVPRPGSLSVLLVDLPWDEESPPTIAHADPDRLVVQAVPFGEENGRRFLSVDVTAAVLEWVDGLAANHGIALVSDGGALVANSKENRAGGHEPTLEIVLRGGGSGGGPSTIAITGPPGPQGPAGDQGPTGPPGAALNPLRIALMRWYEANETGWSTPAGNRPEAVLFDGEAVWSASYDDGVVKKHKVSNGIPVGSAAVGSGPVALAFDGLHIWVANSLSDNIMKLNSVNGSLQATVPAGTTPTALAFDGTYVWSANQGSNNLTKVRASDAALMGSFAACTAPGSILYDGTWLWVSCTGDNTLLKVDPQTGSGLQTIAVGSSPSGLAFDGEAMWVVNSGDGTVSEINHDTGDLLGTFFVGTSPSGIAFDGEAVWVTNTGSGDVTKLSAADGSLRGTFAAEAGPTGITFDGIYMWIANSLSGTLSKL